MAKLYFINGAWHVGKRYDSPTNRFARMIKSKSFVVRCCDWRCFYGCAYGEHLNNKLFDEEEKKRKRANCITYEAQHHGLVMAGTPPRSAQDIDCGERHMGRLVVRTRQNI